MNIDTTPASAENLARFLSEFGGYYHAYGWHTAAATVDGSTLTVTVTAADAEPHTFHAVVVEGDASTAETAKLREELAEMEAVSTDWAARHIGVTQELTQLREQRAALLKLHKYDELIFGGFICTHCTAEDCDDPDDNVYWPCPSLRSVGVTDEEAVAIITAHRAEIAREAAQKAGAL